MLDNTIEYVSTDYHKTFIFLCAYGLKGEVISVDCQGLKTPVTGDDKLVVEEWFMEEIRTNYALRSLLHKKTVQNILIDEPILAP